MTLGPAGDGMTPISYDEAEQLIPQWVETRGQLNEVESSAIAAALAALPSHLTLDTILDEGWLIGTHRTMFAPVWRWAGRLRQADLSIGQSWHQVPNLLRHAVADAQLWFAVMTADEAAIRLHHRLVWIHPFSNGNGRWSRLVSDLAVVAAGGEAFTWGRDVAAAEQRSRYVHALRAADRANEIAELLAFARS